MGEGSWGSHRKGAREHENACYEEHLKEEALDTGKLYRLCKKAKKLDDDGVAYPLSVSYVEYFTRNPKEKKVKEKKHRADLTKFFDND